MVFEKKEKHSSSGTQDTYSRYKLEKLNRQKKLSSNIAAKISFV